MTITSRKLSICLAAIVVGVALGGCGTTDEQQIRAITKDFQKRTKDAGRVCAHMTPRAQAQITGFISLFAGAGDCPKIIGKLEPDDATPREIDKARVAIRGDAALLRPRRGAPAIGFRQVDGTWKIDNIVNATLDEKPRRPDPALARGTDEQQLRATYNALSDAFAKRDYERGCELFSYGAEAQLVIGRLFAGIFGAESSGKTHDLSCAASMRALAHLAGGPTNLALPVPSPSALAAANVSIHADQATVTIAGEKPSPFVRQDGHWLAGPSRESISVDEPPTAASLKRCWRRAGASIATQADELRFALGFRARAITVSPGRTSVKGNGWRIFYAHGQIDPGLRRVLRHPRSVPVVAYVTNARARASTVTRARACS